MFDFCQPVINVVLRTDTIKDMNARIFVTGKVGELDGVVCQDDVDYIRHDLDQVAQKCRRRHFPAFSTRWTKVNFDVRSMATHRYSLPSSVRTSAILI